MGSELISSTISLISWQRLSFWSSLSTLGTNFVQIYSIFSSSQIIVCTVPTLTSNSALIVSIHDGRYPWNSLFGQSTLVYWLPYSPHATHHPSLIPCFPWISFATQNLMLDSCKVVQKQSEEFHTFLWHFFPNLKQNFIAYRSSKVSSHPDCIFEIYQQWQSGFSRVYFNCSCSCSFEAEIIKIGQSSHKM